MNLKILVFKSSLVLRFKLLDLFDLLLLDSQLELLHIRYLELVVMDGMLHAILLSLHEIKLHLNCLLRFVFSVPHYFLIFEDFLPVFISGFIHFEVS